jgi:cyclopropane-fatty-acyl-phospholipid synthase
MTSDNRSTGADALAGGAHLEAADLAGDRPVPRDWTGRMLAKLFQTLNHPSIRIVLWNGMALSGSAKDPVATVTIHDRALLLRLILNPDLYFGEGYMAGDIEVDGDLIGFLEEIYKSRACAPRYAVLERLSHSLQDRLRSNTVKGSRRNIHHHYDLSNSFYELWLDKEAMQYTCGYFPRPQATLEEAQVAKLDHVCRKLRLRPGETVVEAGCGWGGLARHMARHYGVRVKAYNISREQIAYARECAAREGVEGRVEYIEDDYRNIAGRYDAFVSIGMLEHVGVENYRALGDVIHRSLRDCGRGLIHTIGRNYSAPMNAWIARRIFPGARPPSLREMMELFEHHRFSVLDVENLRLHYAETLSHWLTRFEAHAGRVREMFDESFERAWRLYLAGSVAAFRTGQLQLFQVLFNRPRNNDIPMTREYLYGPKPDQP